MYNRIPIQILISLIIIFSQSTVRIKYASSFRIDMIHINSPQSPFYNKSISQSELIAKEVQRSHARVNSLRTSSSYTNEKLMESMIEGDGFTYLTKYRLGSKKIVRHAVASPTTNFIWTKCMPVDQDAKSFVRGDSTSYKAIESNDPICKKINFRLPSSSTSAVCKYNYNVGEQIYYSRGEVGEDKYYFASSKPEEGNRYRIKKTIFFGCSEEDSDLGNDYHGVVGFGPGTISLVSQLGTDINYKFGYCLHPPENKRINSLWFGNIDDRLEKMMVSSPLQLRTRDASKYYLNLEGVSINDSKIETSHLILIDYQTPFTHLRRSVYLQVEDRIRTNMPYKSKPLPGFNLCFDYDLVDSDMVPNIVFHFAEASMELKFLNVFVDVNESDFCLAIFPITIKDEDEDEDEDEHSIFGGRAQANHPMMFDIQENRVSFTYFACFSFKGIDF